MYLSSGGGQSRVLSLGNVELPHIPCLRVLAVMFASACQSLDGAMWLSDYEAIKHEATQMMIDG